MASSFGELERAVLDVLWDAAEAGASQAGAEEWLTVRQVHEALADRGVAYTTVMTVMDRLARKDQIAQRRDGRAYTYRPRASRSELTAELLRETLDDFGTDNRRSALMAFVEDASAADVDSLRAALARLEGRQAR